MLRPGLLLLLLVVGSLASTAALAEPPPVPSPPPAAAPAAATGDADTVDLAKRHYDAASAYFEEGRYDEAVREFRESYRLAQRAELLYNIARSYTRKGDAARAVEAYEEYLRAKPNAQDEADTRSTIETLRKSTGSVRIVGAPDGAALFVDGAAVGSAPLAAPVLATMGRRTVVARPQDGSAARSVEVEVPAGGLVEAALPQPREAVKVIEQVKVVEVETHHWYDAKLGWALVGGGALVAVSGAVLLGLVGPQIDDARAATTESSWRAAEERARAFDATGVTLLTVGAVAAAAGVVVFVVKGRSRGEAEPRSTGIWIAPAGGGLAVGGGF